MFNFSVLRNVDGIIIVCVLTLMVVGLVFIYSGSYYLRYDTGTNYMRKQAVWIAAGLLIALGFILLDYRKLAHAAPMLYMLAVIILVLVLLGSDPRRGARSWFFLGGLALQPSEFAKLALILVLGKYLSSDYFSRSSWMYLLGALILTIIPTMLILKQPDLGTAMVFLPVLLAMLIVARANTRSIFSLVIAGFLAMPMCWSILKPYQQSRIKVFLNPQLDPLKSGYNAIQSRIAVGSGGLFGQGWLHGTQTHLRFLPERHTDFIFCVLGEEAGFFGCFFLISLYTIIVLRGLRVADQARDEFGRLVAVGLTVLLASHVVINIGMTIGLLPITGLPLPLMSYGGSSLIITLISIGILESIYARRFVF